MISDEEIKQRQAQLDREEVLYEWEAIYPAIVGKNGKLIRFSISILPMLIVGILFTWFVIVKDAYIGLLPMYSALIIVSYTSYSLQFADYKCQYLLTPKGVITYTKQNIPKAVYSFVRGLAWFGMGVCVVAVVVVGPMVFFGAGAFALMSFAFRNFKPKVDKDNYIFINDVKIFDIYKENHIMFMSSPFFIFAKTRLFYNTLEEKKIILEHLNKVLIEPSFLRVETTKEAYQDDFIKTAFKLHNDMNRERNKNHQ